MKTTRARTRITMLCLLVPVGLFAGVIAIYMQSSVSYRVEKLLLRIADDHRGREKCDRKEISDSIVKIGPAAVEPMISHLANSDPYMRYAAAWGLWAIPDSRATGPLCAAMKDKRIMVRRQAARALAVGGDRRSASALAEALQDPEFGVKHMSVLALARVGGPDAVSALIRVVRDPTENRSVTVMIEGRDRFDRHAWREMPLRMFVARKLEKIVDRCATDELISAVKDEDPMASGAAMYLLAGISGDKTVETLLAELESHNAVRSNNAAFALGRMTTPRIVEPLIRALGCGNVGAAHSLGSLGDPRAAPPLIEALKGRTTSVSRNLGVAPTLFGESWLSGRDIRCMAALALGQLGDPRAVEPLKRIVLTNDCGISRAARDALEKIQTKQAQ